MTHGGFLHRSDFLVSCHCCFLFYNGWVHYIVTTCRLLHTLPTTDCCSRVPTWGFKEYNYLFSGFGKTKSSLVLLEGNKDKKKLCINSELRADPTSDSSDPQCGCWDMSGSATAPKRRKNSITENTRRQHIRKRKEENSNTTHAHEHGYFPFRSSLGKCYSVYTR